MELVEGKTLRELLYAGPLPARKALQMAAQLADALARAHEAGIVHRDLKPENVMLSREGFAKILDFGLAKFERGENGAGKRRDDLTLTEEDREPSIVGTSGYMSPEQASGQAVDFRSDQFSFGTLLYEMVTGRRAFQRATRAETLVAIIREEPEPLGADRAAVADPGALDRGTVPGQAAGRALRLDAGSRARPGERARSLFADRRLAERPRHADAVVRRPRRRLSGTVAVAVAGAGGRGVLPGLERPGPRLALVPAADVSRRDGVVGPVRPRRPHGGLRGGLERRPHPHLHGAARDARVLAAGASTLEPAGHVALGRDRGVARGASRRRLHDDRHARALDARRRRARARCWKGFRRRTSRRTESRSPCCASSTARAASSFRSAKRSTRRRPGI